MEQRRARLEGQLVGGFFLVMGGVHLGLVSADPEVYRHVADHGLFAFGWWIWLWCIPVLTVLVTLARRDLVRSH